jgi:hypothetical protein
MIEYLYYDKNNPVNLSALGAEIVVAIPTVTYDGSRWDQGCGVVGKPPCEPGVCIQPCTGRLRVYFETDLTNDEKNTLDAIVAKY